MAVKWGVIGAGGIADRRTIPEGIIGSSAAELVAVQDVAEDLIKEVAAKYGVPGYVSEYDLLNDPNVEAVYIATPTHLHHAQVMAAAEAGKHVLCEKPMALSVEQCEEMIEECESRGVKLGVNFMMRFHACHQLLRSMVAENKVGTTVMGRAELTCWYPPIPGAFRQDPQLGGGGSFIDMGNHCADLLEFIFGSRAAEVMCYTANLVQDYATEDTAVAMLKLENGAVCVVDALFNVPDAAARWPLEVYGSKGVVYSNATIGQGSEGKLVTLLETGDKDYDAAQVKDEGSLEKIITPDVVNIYQAHIDGFCDAVVNDTTPPVPGEDGLWSQKLMTACYESARSGKAVKVS